MHPTRRCAPPVRRRPLLRSGGQKLAGLQNQRVLALLTAHRQRLQRGSTAARRYGGAERTAAFPRRGNPHLGSKAPAVPVQRPKPLVLLGTYRPVTPSPPPVSSSRLPLARARSLRTAQHPASTTTAPAYPQRSPLAAPIPRFGSGLHESPVRATGGSAPPNIPNMSATFNCRLRPHLRTLSAGKVQKATKVVSRESSTCLRLAEFSTSRPWAQSGG